MCHALFHTDQRLRTILGEVLEEGKGGSFWSDGGAECSGACEHDGKDEDEHGRGEGRSVGRWDLAGSCIYEGEEMTSTI